MSRNYTLKSSTNTSIDTATPPSNNNTTRTRAFVFLGVALVLTTVCLRMDFVMVADSQNNLIKTHKKTMQIKPMAPLVLENHNTEPTKPTLVILAGPVKHATSYLQCLLSMNAYSYLQRDNYQYLGTCSCAKKRAKIDGDLPNQKDVCLGHSSSSVTDEKGNLTSIAATALGHALAQGSNAMFVWEYFSMFPEPKIRRFMEQVQGWNVKVVLFYRPLYDFLPSIYSQAQRPKAPIRPQYRVWLNQTAETGSRVGRPILPFSILYEKKVSELKDYVIAPWVRFATMLLEDATHLSKEAMHHWIKHPQAQQVQVIPLKTLVKYNDTMGDPVLSYLACKILTNATHTCQAARTNQLQHRLDSASANNRFPCNYDMLARAAKEKGWLERRPDEPFLDRPAVWNAIQQRQQMQLNKTDTAFPLVCLNDTFLNILFNQSLAVEQKLFPGHEAEHRNDFLRAVAKNKFCHVDTDATLQQDGWRKFFLTLNRTTTERAPKVWR